MRARSTPHRPIVRAFILLCPLLLLAACGSSTVTHNRGFDPPSGDGGGGNGGGGGLGGGGGVTNPPITEVTLNGAVTFDLVPFKATAGGGLDYAATRQAPVRTVSLEIVNFDTNAIIASTTTDVDGKYSVTVPANTVMKVRVKAEMGNVHVLDNTNADTLYEYEDAQFSSGAIEPRVRDVNIPSGWDGTGYTQPRSAAPFAILDDIYNAQQFVSTNVAGITFPALNVYWSKLNSAALGSADDFDTDRALGVVETTQYATEVTAGTTKPGLYVLGDADSGADSDTDEYDADVVIGAWTAFYLESFSRDDTMGGTYADAMDLRAAYSQGWQVAFPLMVKGSSVYRDSSGMGQATSDDFDAEPNTIADAGWYNPNSIASILYDLWDSNNDGMDTVSLPFSTLHNTLVAMKNTTALTSIYPFATALLAQAPLEAPQISALISAQNILAPTLDDFGTGETNNGGSANNLPIYRPVTLNVADTMVSAGSPDNYYNGFGNRRYFVMTLPVTTGVQVRVQAPSGYDPDIVAYQNGVRIDDGSGETDSSINGYQTLVLDDLPPGTYIIEVYDSNNVYPEDPDTDTGDVTMTVRVVG